MFIFEKTLTYIFINNRWNILHWMWNVCIPKIERWALSIANCQRKCHYSWKFNYLNSNIRSCRYCDISITETVMDNIYIFPIVLCNITLIRYDSIIRSSGINWFRWIWKICNTIRISNLHIILVIANCIRNLKEKAILDIHYFCMHILCIPIRIPLSSI